MSIRHWGTSPCGLSLYLILIACQSALPQNPVLPTDVQPQATPNNPLAQPVPAAVQIASGQVSLEHSLVYIRVDKARIGHEHAIMGKLKSGELHLAAAENPQIAPGSLVFDMTTFDADSDEARKYIGLTDSIDAATRKQVNENMLGKEVLDVKKYPTATFICKKMNKLGEASSRGLQQYMLEGDFTLHGTTKPIRFTLDVDQVKGWLRIRGAFAILQTQFGIKPYSKLFGAIGVADRLDIYGDLILAP